MLRANTVQASSLGNHSVPASVQSSMISAAAPVRAVPTPRKAIAVAPVLESGYVVSKRPVNAPSIECLRPLRKASDGSTPVASNVAQEPVPSAPPTTTTTTTAADVLAIAECEGAVVVVPLAAKDRDQASSEALCARLQKVEHDVDAGEAHHVQLTDDVERRFQAAWKTLNATQAQATSVASEAVTLAARVAALERQLAASDATATALAQDTELRFQTLWDAVHALTTGERATAAAVEDAKAAIAAAGRETPLYCRSLVAGAHVYDSPGSGAVIDDVELDEPLVVSHPVVVVDGARYVSVKRIDPDGAIRHGWISVSSADEPDRRLVSHLSLVPPAHVAPSDDASQ